MGEKQIFQPLTREDRITVVLYRTGIVLSTVILSGIAYILSAASTPPASDAGRLMEVAGYSLLAAIGLSVFFIHLYVSAFKRFLIGLYVLSLICVAALAAIGKGSLAGGLRDRQGGLLLPSH